MSDCAFRFFLATNLYFWGYWLLRPVHWWAFWLLGVESEKRWDNFSCTLPEHLAAENATHGRVKVVIPSTGQTGSTSVIDVFKEAGYRAYHVEETATHLSVLLDAKVSAEEVSRATSRCKIDVISLEPYIDSFPLFLETNPDVKVILTWRDYWSWDKSANGYSGGGRKDMRWGWICAYVFASYLYFPYQEVLERLTGVMTAVRAPGDPFNLDRMPFWRGVANYMIMKSGHRYGAVENELYLRGTYHQFRSNDIYWIEENYIAWQDEVRRLVRPENLLEFDVKKHGYAELYNFLGDDFANLKDHIGQRLPHPRSKASWTNDNLMIMHSDICLTSMAIAMVVHFVNVFVTERTYIRLLFFMFRQSKQLLCSILGCRGAAPATKDKAD